jgi:NADPH-dependent curcumin reductase CurA
MVNLRGSPPRNRQYLLAGRPVGPVLPEHFSFREADIPDPADGEALVRNLLVSIDPAMRGWMVNRADYVAPLNIGDVMRATCVSRVTRSRRADIAEDELIVGSFGWQDYAILNGPAQFSRVDPTLPPSASLSLLGTTGYTAYFGMHEIGAPKPAETVVVSGAAGAVGSVAGQIAKISGARVIGIAGSEQKCQWLIDFCGFDSAVNYKTEDVGARLTALAPDGIDVYFDNVGGEILDLALARLANYARIVLCGGISRSLKSGPIPGPSNYFNLVFRRAKMQGFIVLDYASRFHEAAAALAPWVRSGKLKYAEHIVEGFERLPDALAGIFRGENTGKQMVRIAG